MFCGGLWHREGERKPPLKTNSQYYLSKTVASLKLYCYSCHILLYDVSRYNLFLCVFMQIWPPTAALGVLSGIHTVFTPERVLDVIHYVCHHEVFHGGGPRGDSHHFFCLK